MSRSASPCIFWTYCRRSLRRNSVSLDDGALRGLAGRERRDLDLSLLRLATESFHLAGEQLVTRGQGGEVRRQHGEAEGLLLLMERLVLLRLPCLSLEGRELPAHLVHHVAHALEILPGGIELPCVSPRCCL